MDIHKYLNDLENRLDEQQEAQLLQEYYDFADKKMKDRNYFRPERIPSPGNLNWDEVVYYNDTYDDYDKMLYKQLVRCNEQLSKGGGELLSARSSFGTGLIPSMFGCEVKILPLKHDSLPVALPISWEKAQEIVKDYKNGIKPDVRSGLGQKSIDAAHHMENLLKDYPKLSKYMHIYQPDTQGPCSIAEAILGSLFYELLYDEEDAIKEFIEVVTDTFIRYIEVWKEEFPYCDSEYSFDYGLICKGGIMIREDSTCNISGIMYDEFFKEQDQKILDAFNGGAVHFCGKGDHLIKSFSELDGLNSVNISQPDLNDMDNLIYPNTIDKGIELTGIANYEMRRVNRHKIDLKGLVQIGVCVAAWMGEPETDPRGEDC